MSDQRDQLDRRKFLHAVSGAVLGAGITERGGTVLRQPSPAIGTGAGVHGRVTAPASVGSVGGSVEVMRSGVLVASAPVGIGGGFAVDLEPGSYDVRYDPGAGYSVADGIPDWTKLAVPRGVQVPLTFQAQPAEWFDDFQSYTDDADLHERFGNDDNGRQLLPGGPFTPCLRELVRLDPTGGPGDTKAMRYDYWNRVANPSGKGVVKSLPECARPDPCESAAIYMARRWNSGAAENNEWWLRFTSKEGTPPRYFTFGVGSCREAIQYKFFRWRFANRNIAPYDMILSARAQDMNPRTGHYLIWRAHDTKRGRQSGFTNRIQLGNTSDWAGRWHTWVTGFRANNGNWDDVHFWLYRDGRLIKEERKAWGPPGALGVVQLGANSNAGPDQAQHRWFREVGIYRTRPSLTPIA